MYICMYVCAYTHVVVWCNKTWIVLWWCMHINVYVYMYVCMCIYPCCSRVQQNSDHAVVLYVYKRVCVYVCMYVCMYVCAYTYVVVGCNKTRIMLWFCMHVNVYVCMYVWPLTAIHMRIHLNILYIHNICIHMRIYVMYMCTYTHMKNPPRQIADSHSHVHTPSNCI
jgi:hypothetical protein